MTLRQEAKRRATALRAMASKYPLIVEYYGTDGDFNISNLPITPRNETLERTLFAAKRENPPTNAIMRGTDNAWYGKNDSGKWVAV